jgi:hypothetical protein
VQALAAVAQDPDPSPSSDAVPRRRIDVALFCIEDLACIVSIVPGHTLL